MPKLYREYEKKPMTTTRSGRREVRVRQSPGPAGVYVESRKLSVDGGVNYLVNNATSYQAPHPNAPSCTTSTSSTTNPGWPPVQWTNAPDDDTYNCTEDTRTWVIFHRTAKYGSPITGWGCPLIHSFLVEEESDLETKTEQKETLSDPVTKSAMMADANASLADEDWAETTPSTSAMSSCSWPDIDDATWTDCETGPTPPELTASANLREIRYRITIPHDFDPPPLPQPQKWHGIWHRIQLIETFTPADHNPGDPASPQPVETPREVIWTGPGTEIDFPLDGDYTPAEQAAIDSWKSPWVEIAPPAEPGEISVRVLRSQCYHGAPWVWHG